MITGASKYRPGDQVIITALGQTCFYCRGSTTDPGITWMGATGEIFLHPSCAVELVIRLLRDVHELECSSGLRLKLAAYDIEAMG